MIINSFAAETRGSILSPFTYSAELTLPLECRIEVETCGICHSDIHMIDNDWKSSVYPFVGGHEVVGKVVEIGNMVGHLKIGDRVGVGWQSGACLECRDCLRGDENLCDHNKATIVGRHGGFADNIIIDSRFAFKIPENIESQFASPLLCAGITVYAALKYAGMKPGGHVGIIGVGGLGHLAIQFASKLGNKVTVFTTSQDKADFAKNLGASEVYLNPKSKDKVKNKLDIILNTTHNDLDWKYYLNQLNSDGTLVFVGIPPTPLNVHVGLLLGKRKRIMASPIGGRSTIVEMLEIASEHDIKPIIEVFKKEEINSALTKVRENKVRYRAVVDFKK
jgi:alcohol/geraniol dehydrogenase (NADP+)